MKILHCCLANFYIDGYGYQENILPKHHKSLGHVVKIIASTETYINNQKLGYVKPGQYINEHDIPVKRLPYVKWIPNKIVKKLRIYENLDSELSDFKPDIIFVHNFQFLSIKCISNYASNNKCRVIVDSHTDFINSAKSYISKNILHKLIYKWCAKKIEPFTSKFYGTLPLRCKFLEQIYDIDKNKIELLEFGFDDLEIRLHSFGKIRETIRKTLGVRHDEIVILAGGKIDSRKNYIELVRAYKKLNSEKSRLVLFGKPSLDLKKIFNEEIKSKRIIYLGWLEPVEIRKLMIASDIVVFPGTHSVLWEEAVGAGIPCVFKRWTGIEHIDLSGNCIFIEEGSENELLSVLNRVVNEPFILEKMKDIATSNKRNRFLYSEIAKKSLIS